SDLNGLGLPPGSDNRNDSRCLHDWQPLERIESAEHVSGENRNINIHHAVGSLPPEAVGRRQDGIAFPVQALLYDLFMARTYVESKPVMQIGITIPNDIQERPSEWPG